MTAAVTLLLSLVVGGVVLALLGAIVLVYVLGAEPYCERCGIYHPEDWHS